METIKIWLSAFVSFIILDLAWFSAFASKFTKEKLGALVRLNNSGGIDANIKAAILVYALMATAFVFFVLPKTNGLSPLKSGLWGALLGIAMFGLYELTNYSFIKGWDMNFVVVDIIWGAVAFFITTVAIKLIFKI